MQDNIFLKKSFWHSFNLISGQVFLIPLLLISVSLTTRILGTEGYGRLSLFLSVCQAAFILGITWTRISAVRYGLEEFDLKKKINVTFWSRTVLVLISTALTVVLLVLFRRDIIRYISLDQSYFYLVVIYFLALVISQETQNYLRAINALNMFIFLNVFEKILVIAGLTLIITGILPAGFLTVLILFTGVKIGLFLFYLLKVVRKYALPVSFDYKRLKKIFNFSLPIIFRSINSYVSKWANVFIINFYMSVSAVGIYSLAVRGMGVLMEISMLAPIATMPLIISFINKNQKHLIVKYLTRFVPQALFFWVIMLYLCMLFSKPIILFLAGKEFSAAIVPFASLLIALFGSALGSLCLSVNQAYELTKEMTIVESIGITIHLCLAFLLIPRLGINGAVIAVASSLFFNGLMRLFVVNNKLKIQNYMMVLLVLPLVIAFLFFILLSGISSYILGILTFSLSLYFIARRQRIFKTEDVSFLEVVHMPVFLNQGIKKIYVILS